METLQVAQDGGVVTVILDRPEKKNAINDQMWDDLELVLRELRNDAEARCVVLTGAGGAFCSGADLSAGGGREVHQLRFMRRVADVCLALHGLPMPVIAKVGGVAAGAGCSMALGCDLVVAGESARFSLIFAKRGLSLDFGASFLLPRLVGLHKAKRKLALFADILSAADAERLGIVNRVVPDAELDAAVDDWSRRLAAGPPLALSMTKALLDAGASSSLEQALEAEGAAQTVNFGTEDTMEAMKAFVERRPPSFRGR